MRQEGLLDFREEGLIHREGYVEHLGDSHNLRIILGWGIAHGGIEGKMGERQWK